MYTRIAALFFLAASVLAAPYDITDRADAIEERTACPPPVNSATLSLVEASESWSAKACKSDALRNYRRKSTDGNVFNI